MTRPITREMFDAWETLQEFARRAPLSDLARAIDVLDNSDFMAPIVNEFICGDQSAGLPEPPCDLDKPCPVHDTPTPVAIVPYNGMFRATYGDGRTWTVGSTREEIERELAEGDAHFIIVTPEELAAHPKVP